jgi:DNA-binding CsgD family transcriptional regulator
LYLTVQDQSFDGWTGIFGQLSEMFSSGPGSLSFHPGNNKNFDLFVSTLDLDLFEEYNSYYQFISPFRQQILQLKPGEKFNREAACSDKAFLETEIYQDFFKRQDVFNYEYRVLFKEAGTTAGISFSRSRRMKNFDARDYKIMDLLLPHVQNALRIHLQFAKLEREKKILLECFERASQRIVVVDRSGKAVFINKSADRLIAAKNGLQTDAKGFLSANFAQDSKSLRLLLQRIFEPDLDQPANSGSVLQISRKNGARPLSVFAAPFVESESAYLRAEKLAILFVNDPEHEVEDIEPDLIRIYKLTPAESRITAILARGKSLNEACRLLEIRPNTIRTHLKRIFSKTETNRQSELVKLILSNLSSVRNIANNPASNPNG